ncbi:3890_t:CDS:2, partial [Funneliformis geosporum]
MAVGTFYENVPLDDKWSPFYQPLEEHLDLIKGENTPISSLIPDDFRSLV